MQRVMISGLLVALLVSFPVFDSAVAALPDCEPVVGQLTSAEGVVRVQRSGGGSWEAAGVGAMLCDKDTVRTEANSRAAVALVNDAVFRIDQNTAVHLADIAPEPEEKSFVQLLVGAIQSFSRKPREVAIDTPYLNATIEGTEFVIRVAQNETELTVFEGTVRAANDQGQEAVTSGQMVVAQAGQAPQRRVVVRPRDAAQWSIYYPPALGTGKPPSDLPPAIAEAAGLAGQGNAAGALEAMDRVPAAQQDARYQLYRSSFLLAAGQVDQARAAIDRALQLDSGSGLAYAQRAVIDVAQNRKDEALANGRRAVELAPDSAEASIALSYALQATFQLGEARQTLERAVAASPDDALARARLAELWMMIGYRDRARAEAEKAVELQPGLERAQVVLGFAALVEIRTGQAKEAFNKAIALDSDDPMAHLGLGLATIREGDLAEGRKQIEVAVALDPENALLRSYLGKAYFDEKREGLDAQQLALAKERDPNDPTAYLYDALRKQSENRPGEALQDLQKSIQLNDNRAVYRGRLQLDEDRAARGASLANIYSDLGFTRMGLNEATKSLTDDPTNASAHRFLSDTYADMRRYEIARVSEQLQAQMLQDVNINPVSPSGSVGNLGTVGGAGSAGFNEYTALFERNQAQLDASGSYGTDSTWSGEGVASAVYDWFSVSAGAYHYETDGWRDNHNIEHDIQNVYAQAALTPDLNMQLEYRNRKTTAGDVALNFDPAIYDPTVDRELDQQIGRAGIRYSPTPSSDILFSYIFSDREETLATTFPVLGAVITEELPFDDIGNQFEAQYLNRSDRLNLAVGGGYSVINRDRLPAWIFAEDFVPGFPPGCDPNIDYLPDPGLGGCAIDPAPAGDVLAQIPISEDIDHIHGYAYVNATYPESVTWTLGASYDNLDQVGAEVEEFNPKLGVQWDATDALRLRAAAFQVVKPAIVANRTIEPTQVAGFNQFFDDINGTVSKAAGIGIDWEPTARIFVGAEAMARKYEEYFEQLTFGLLSGGGFRTVSTPRERDEQIYRGYLYWNPIPEVSLNIGATYDRYTSEAILPSAFGAEVFFPKEVVTISVPVGIRYFHGSGLFANAGATVIDQDVTRHAGSALPAGSDSFITVDAGVGWRFPNRAGAISLEGRNLFDEQFNYQDDNYREFRDDPTPSQYVPARTIMGRLTLKF